MATKWRVPPKAEPEAISLPVTAVRCTTETIAVSKPMCALAGPESRRASIEAARRRSKVGTGSGITPKQVTFGQEAMQFQGLGNSTTPIKGSKKIDPTSMGVNPAGMTPAGQPIYVMTSGQSKAAEFDKGG